MNIFQRGIDGIKKDHVFILILAALSSVKFIVHWIGNRNYGFYRDELIHLSVSEHMDWGFMEFPPFIGLLGKLSYWLFDYDLIGVRLFPTMAGVGILILCGLMVRAFGGKSRAVFLSGICVLAFLPFYRNHTLFQPVAFDQLFWALGFFFLIKYIVSEDKKYLLLIGFTFGIGLMNKYTMIIWGFAVCLGLLFHKQARPYKSKWLYISACISLLIFLPNIIWQIQHDIPFLKHLELLNAKQLTRIGPFDFVLSQINYPYTLTVSLLGLYAMMIDKRLRKFRVVGIVAIIIFITMWALNSKAYYVFAIYPVLFSAGSVCIESLLERKPVFIYLVSALVLLPCIYDIPRAIPILPIEEYVTYRNFAEEDGRIELTGDYADMFGWEEQVQLVDSLYHSFTVEQQQNTVIWASNYGEGGAIKILGKKYNLPNPICTSGTFWLWGYGDANAEQWICLGIEKSYIDYLFDESTLVKTIYHKYAIDEENNIPLYVCRKPRVRISQFWADYEEHIFD